MLHIAVNIYRYVTRKMSSAFSSIRKMIKKDLIVSLSIPY